MGTAIFFSNMDGLWTVNYLTNRLEYQWNESYRSHISWVYISPQMVAWNFLRFTYLIGIITSMKESYWKKKKKRQPSFIPREICRVHASDEYNEDKAEEEEDSWEYEWEDEDENEYEFYEVDEDEYKVQTFDGSFSIAI